MSIKATGVFDEQGVKNYILMREDGVHHIAFRVGSKWEFDGKILPSIKACKEALERMDVDVEKRQTFDCVDPCALLVLTGDIDSDAARRTLDCYGWIDENGFVDVDRAKRQMKVFNENQ